MGIKSEKTFEEIVERLVALFQPQPEEGDADAVQSQPSTSNTSNTSNTSKTDATIPLSSTTGEDQAQ
jgi:hypothetical protein